MKVRLDADFVTAVKEPGAYWDTTWLRGFGLKVTDAGKKVYICEAKLKGTRKNVRVTIGDATKKAFKTARDEAKQHLADIADGKNPVEARRSEVKKQEAEQRTRDITLRVALDEYIGDRSELKPTSAYIYKDVSSRCLGDWLDRPLADITKFDVEKRYDELKAKPGQANQCMRMLSAVFNWALEKYEDGDGQSLIKENPVKRLSRLRKWVQLERRDDVLTPAMLPLWYEAVNDLTNPGTRDLLLLLLFTGLRKNEGARLTFNDCDFDQRTITILETKNGQRHIIPMSDFVYDMLLRRKQNRFQLSRYVFPGSGSRQTKYLHEVSTAVKQVRMKMAEKLGIDYERALREKSEDEIAKFFWMPHSLRRTFLTVADQLGYGSYTLKRMVNHSAAGDVTAGYVVVNVDSIREPMQKIADHILKIVSVESMAIAK
jgi:integrase